MCILLIIIVVCLAKFFHYDIHYKNHCRAVKVSKYKHKGFPGRRILRL